MLVEGKYLVSSYKSLSLKDICTKTKSRVCQTIENYTNETAQDQERQVQLVCVSELGYFEQSIYIVK